MSTPAAVQTHRLGRRYGSRWALRECSLALPGGAVVGLVGPNGAGKTTLLHLAVGVLRPTSGTIRVFGQPVSDRPAALATVGFVGQNKPLYTGFRVEEMLRFGARLNPRWDDALARERLACAGVRLEQRVGQLSGGQHAQVALALALGKRPRLLLLDEPVANLDPLARRQFLQTLMEEVATGELTVVLSSHLIEDLDRSCDYLVLLSDSRVQLAGTTERLLAEHRVITGPAEAVAALARQHTVVRPSPPGRVANVLLHLSGHSGTAHTDLGAVHDPSVTVREVSLEDLVLAYMSQPGASAGGPAGLAAVSAVSAVSE